MDIWAAIADERRGLADDLEALAEPAWSAVTTCGGWTVHQLVAHLTVPLTASRLEPVVTVMRCRGNINRALEAMTLARSSKASLELVRTLRERAERRFTPPGLGPTAPLSDAIIHGIELRRAAGLTRAVDPERMRTVLDFVTSGKARGFVPASRTRGLRIEATDVDWSAGDAGAPLVRGPCEDLALAITGRPSGLDAIEGDGVAILADRIKR